MPCEAGWIDQKLVNPKKCLVNKAVDLSFPRLFTALFTYFGDNDYGYLPSCR